tara:strand:- start:30701 stop:31423 length:723 start_codon:yes stop_codon:yes gene_type:complete
MNTEQISQKTSILFDLDGTLTESRSLISKQMSKLLIVLASKMDVVVISGAQLSQMKKQIPWIMNGAVIAMGQSGNEVPEYWENKLTDVEVQHVLNHIEKIKKIYRIVDVDENDQIESRGGQVAFSLIGHNADKERKREFDSSGEFRLDILRNIPFVHELLMARVAGTTCFDYTRKDWGKAGNITRLMQKRRWDKNACLYIGDALFEGGNDYPVKETGIECVAVSGPEDTKKIIDSLLLNK